MISAWSLYATTLAERPCVEMIVENTGTSTGAASSTGASSTTSGASALNISVNTPSIYVVTASLRYPRIDTFSVVPIAG